MNKRYYEHTLPIIRGSLSNTYGGYHIYYDRKILRQKEVEQLKSKLE